MSGVIQVGARRSRRRAGFYRKALQREESGDGGRVDVGEIKQRLIEEMRRRPGELHLLLQGSKVVLRAEALERRRSRAEDDAARMAAVYEALDQLEGQIGRGSPQL